MKAGEYMQEFKSKYKEQQIKDNFNEINVNVLTDIVNMISALISEGKFYKGKSGENFRIYTLRLLECFALCNVSLNDKVIIIFQVNTI